MYYKVPMLTWCHFLHLLSNIKSFFAALVFSFSNSTKNILLKVPNSWTKLEKFARNMATLAHLMLPPSLNTRLPLIYWMNEGYNELNMKPIECEANRAQWKMRKTKLNKTRWSSLSSSFWSSMMLLDWPWIQLTAFWAGWSKVDMKWYLNCYSSTVNMNLPWLPRCQMWSLDFNVSVQNYKTVVTLNNRRIGSISSEYPGTYQLA